MPTLRQPNTPALRQAIREALRDRNWTQERLARETAATGCKVDAGTISKLLSAGRRTVGRDQLAAIAAVLDLDVEALSMQSELQLQIVKRFLPEALEAIDEHILRAETKLAGTVEGGRIFATVSLRLEDDPETRVFEKAFPIRLNRKRHQGTKSS